MFSVIIPLFNKENYIEKCLESVFNQTYQDFEVIVINDGSTDSGADKVNWIIEGLCGAKQKQRNDELIVRSDEGKYLQLYGKTQCNKTISNKSTEKNLSFQLINQENLGVSMTRNNGIKAAVNDYIAFLDADDWWDEHFLEEMRNLIEKFPEAALYGCNYYYFKNGKNRIQDKGLPVGFTSGYIDYISLYASKFVVPINCSFVVVRKKAFLSEEGFKNHLKLGEDFDLWMRLALKHKVAYLNKPLAWSNQDSEGTYRAIGNSKIYNPGENIIFNLGYIFNKEAEIKNLKTLLDGLRVRLLVNYYLMGVYKEKVSDELNKVDFSKQTFYYIFIYKGPRLIVRYYFFIRRFGSKAKQTILRVLWKNNRVDLIRSNTQCRRVVCQ